jgi:phospholipid/cholesterol/gamma-HCH transport system substrate-binding protein
MKLTIRYADKIVGFLIILALSILIFVIFMLGSNQRWFAKDYTFKTYFSSAAGLSQNMPVQYKGFTIGHVKSIKLDENDQVEVRFTIVDTYLNRVKKGSLVEVITSPVSFLGGNQFMFYPGNGIELLDNGDTIPTINSIEGKLLIEQRLAMLPERDDGLNNIMKDAGDILYDVKTAIDTTNIVLSDLQEAFAGSDKTSLGRTIGEVELTVSGLRQMTETLPGELEQSIETIMAQLDPIMVNLRGLTDKIADPDETVMSVLDSEGDVYTKLVGTLNALSGTLQNLEKTSDLFPNQLSALLTDLKTIMRTLEGVLVSVSNNPLLKRGIPERRDANPSGGHARDIEF